MSRSHFPYPLQLAFHASFGNFFNFSCLLGACVCPMFYAQYFLMFPLRLSSFHYSATFENVLCIRWFYCAVPNPSSFAHFFVYLFAPVLHLLHFSANLWDVLGNHHFVALTHNSALCPRPLFPSPPFSLLVQLLQTEGLVCPWLLIVVLNFFHSFSIPVHSVTVCTTFSLGSMYLMWADLLMDLCPRLSWTCILLLPKIAVTLKFG